MSDNLLYFLLFGLPLLSFILIYSILQKRKTKKALAKIEEAKEAGLTEPASLHPDIDPNICLGCATCVTACPEGQILGLIKKKAVLVSPTSCIGHGACKEACPTDAITLVFGTERRGVEIPLVNPEFETSVPNLFIAGELGGMGLIKNAIAQGQQAVQAIAKRKQHGKNELDIIIVGAGPSGLSAALAAKEKKLRYCVLEQDTVGGTVAHYPRGKIVMTQPAKLPIVGKFQYREASKEELVKFWTEVVTTQKLKISTGQNVSAIEKTNNGFIVKTQNKEYTTQTVLLTMGRRGTPRKLGVPGEELPKVVYRLTDPEQYQGQHVLTVGGGDSALEAALAVAEQPGGSSTLIYRGDAFSRAKAKNRDRVDAAVADGSLNLHFNCNVKNITKHDVELIQGKKVFSIKNDAIIVCAGGVLPTPFLKKIGIHVEEKFGTA